MSGLKELVRFLPHRGNKSTKEQKPTKDQEEYRKKIKGVNLKIKELGHSPVHSVEVFDLRQQRKYFAEHAGLSELQAEGLK